MRRLQSMLSNQATSSPPRLTSKQIKVLEKKTNLSEQEIRDWYQSFLEEHPEGRFTEKVYIEKFKPIFPNTPIEDYLKYVFRGMDKNKDQFIDFSEFLISTVVNSTGSWEEQLSDIFDICDLNDDKRLDAKELGDYLSAKLRYYGESDTAGGVSSRERAAQMIAEMATSNDKKITKEEFIAGCKRNPAVFQQFFPQSVICK